VSSTLDDIDLKLMYERLEQRLTWSERAIELPPGRYEVILEPAATADMALYAYVMSSARDADEGRTVFSKPGGGNRIGEKLYPNGVTIYSDPTEPGFETLPFSVALGSSSYSSVFDNGLRLERTDWVRDGVLNALITMRHWAARSHSSAVTPFIPNLIFAGDQGPSTEEMIARTERGLLVTCFWYIRLVDPQTGLLTGLTRDGVYLVEDGEVKGAVNNFRYNMSPVQMFSNAIEIGRPEPTLPREFEFALTRMPALRVRDFHMSSVSDAT
jgi:predicted Zn-dependent protease